jgi:hypothetical protein
MGLIEERGRDPVTLLLIDREAGQGRPGIEARREATARFAAAEGARGPFGVSGGGENGKGNYVLDGIVG